MTKRSNAKSDNKLWRPQVWWTSIIVAIIGLVGILIPLLINNNSNGTSTPKEFTYLVRVQQMGDSQVISNAKVTLEVSGQAPLDEITDSNGLARVFVKASYSGQPGRLLIEAIGYEAYRQEIDLTEGSLPDTIMLERKP